MWFLTLGWASRRCSSTCQIGWQAILVLILILTLTPTKTSDLPMALLRAG